MQISLFRILKNIENHNFSKSDLDYLLDLSIKFSKAYSYRRYSRFSGIKLIDSYSIDELSINAIANLFTKNEKGVLHHIRNPFINWSPKIDTENDALYFLNKLISSSVEQHITELLRESDPVFASLMHNISNQIKNKGYKKIDFLGCKYIVKEEIDFFEHNFITGDQLNKIPVEIFLNKKQVIEKLFAYLESQKNYTIAIPLNELVLKLKSIAVSDNILFSTPDNIEQNINVDAAIIEGISAISKKLNNYQKQGKINSSELECIKKALIDISEDLKDGGMNPGLYKYLQPHMIEISENDYQNKYHNILEYLLKIMKRKITEHLNDKLN